MVLQLQMGNQVELGEIGKFRLQLTSEGTKTADEFKSDVNITGVNIQYVPGEDLANVFTGMEFTQVASRAVQKAALKAEKEGAKILNLEEVKKTGSKSDNPTSGGSTSGDGDNQGGSTPGGSESGGSGSDSGDGDGTVE